MFGVADYGAFVAAIVLFLAIPGPGNLDLLPPHTATSGLSYQKTVVLPSENGRNACNLKRKTAHPELFTLPSQMI